MYTDHERRIIGNLLRTGDSDEVTLVDTASCRRADVSNYQLVFPTGKGRG